AQDRQRAEDTKRPDDEDLEGHFGALIAPATPRPEVLLQLQVAQVGPELGGKLGSLQSELDRGLQPTHRRSAVVAGALELVAVARLLLHQRLDRVGQLDLAAGA